MTDRSSERQGVRAIVWAQEEKKSPEPTSSNEACSVSVAVGSVRDGPVGCEASLQRGE